MKEISILEWNLHFAADKSTVIAPFVKKYLKNFDVLIFTEVVYNDSLKKIIECMDGYDKPFVSIDHGDNQVVIAAKKFLRPRLVFDKIPDISIANSPDFIQIEISPEREKYQIIGSRILVDFRSAKDYEDRRTQFENLVSHIRKFSNVILLGDMNNGQIRGDSEAGLDEVKHLYEKTREGEPSSLKYFNFHIMKEILGDQFTLEEIFGEKSSFGLSAEYGLGTIKNDQLITSKNIKVIQKSYDWDFVRDNKILYEDMYIKKNGRKNWILHGYPDHARLKATVRLES